METAITARYGFKEPRNRAIQRPDDPLYRAFEHWLDEMWNKSPSHQALDLYEEACEEIRKVNGIRERGSSDINAMAVSYQTHPKMREAGLFLSACYNLIGQTDLVWDAETDTKIDWVGYCLHETKRLVLLADTGENTGSRNKGILVNCTNVSGSIGTGSSGSTINLGVVEGYMTPGGSGISVNIGRIMGLMTPSEDCMANISLNRPDGLWLGQGGPVSDRRIYPNGEIFLDDEMVKMHPRLVSHLESFKREMGQNPRNFGIIDKYVGKTNNEFMQKLRGLLDSRTRRLTRFFGAEGMFYGD